MSSTECKNQHCPHTLPIYMVNYELQLCIYPSSDNVKRQWQQCWYHLPIQIVHPEDILSHMWTPSNHMWQDLDSREVVLPHLIMQECAVIFSTDYHSNWHEMVQHKSIFGWKTRHAWLPGHPDCAVQFSYSVTLGHASQHSVISADGQTNTSMTCQLLKCDREMHCLHFSNAADRWW